MKIEIHSSGPDTGLHIYSAGSQHPLRNFRKNIVGLHDFEEEDIQNLLGPAAFSRFLKGDFVFTVPKRLLKVVTGEYFPVNKEEIALYPND